MAVSMRTVNAIPLTWLIFGPQGMLSRNNYHNFLMK